MKKKLSDNKLFFRRMFFVIYDVIAILAASGLAMMLRFDMNIEKITTVFVDSMWKYLPYNIVITIVVFYIFRLYHSLWRFAGLTELQNVISACTVVSFVQYFGMKLLGLYMFRSYYFLYLFTLGIFTLFGRFLYRFLRLQLRKVEGKEKPYNIMVVGAGEASNMLIREMVNSKYLNTTIKCLIDDDKNKIGSYIHGIRVVGDRSSILSYAEEYEINEIIISMPSASRKTIRDIIEICKQTECSLKTLPGMYQLVNGEVSVSKLRNVDVEDLLGREPINVDLKSIMDYVSNKVVLVTGGGGSIGSELCRQIASHNPKQLIIIDIYENNAYDIQQELKHHYPDLNLVVLIASVRNTNRMNHIFEKYKPNIVYHAAAHKHVPLMEDSPNEAIKNNVFGTWKTVQASDMYGVEKFVLISTDKAVNPTNIMGASKRMCEMIIQAYNKKSKTEFVAVRFGNVLGSNGSVIPLFRKQIEAGGPVTVTHPDIIRYFMTIPEAVSLVLQTGAYAKGGEIFILDMGEPVKILDLANNLIRLSGYVPNEDIMIEFTGLRPGEKLYEELLMSEEGMQDTDNQQIHIGKPIEFDDEEYFRELRELKDIINDESVADIRSIIQRIVPTYVLEGNIK